MGTQGDFFKRGIISSFVKQSVCKLCNDFREGERLSPFSPYLMKTKLGFAWAVAMVM
jgi:hypothetical protein